jgi:hypothetical protein
MKHLNMIDTIMIFLETFRGCSRATHWLIGCDLETARVLWPMLERFYPDDSPTLDDDFRFLTSTPATPDGRPCGPPRMMLALSKARMTARQFSWSCARPDITGPNGRLRKPRSSSCYAIRGSKPRNGTEEML